MKISTITAALIGGLVGSAITYSATRLVGGSPHKELSISKVANPTESQSPFEQSEDNQEPADYFRLLLADPTNLIQRDVVIAMWYMNESQTVNYLRVNTGHEFGPVWNQRSPVEILEEQLAFWKKYLAESARLKEIH